HPGASPNHGQTYRSHPTREWTRQMPGRVGRGAAMGPARGEPEYDNLDKGSTSLDMRQWSRLAESRNTTSAGRSLRLAVLPQWSRLAEPEYSYSTTAMAGSIPSRNGAGSL